MCKIILEDIINVALTRAVSGSGRVWLLEQNSNLTSGYENCVVGGGMDVLACHI